MLILLPLRRRISVIFVPARPIMQPTMSDGIEMFCVRICPPLVAAAPFVVAVGVAVEGGAMVTVGGVRTETRGAFGGIGAREDAAAELRAVDAFVERL